MAEPRPDDAEPALVRHTVRVRAADAGAALVALADAFPGGVEEEDAEGDTLLSGYLPAGEPVLVPAPYVVEASVPVAPGWQTGWRAFHRPVRVGRFWIGPPWLTPDPDAEAVVIDPGLAFGTGAHGSTRAAAELLLRLPPGGPLVDLGCGSGVLSILAARLGFGPISALDVDPHAVGATRENAARKGVSLAAVDCTDALIEPLPPVPLALANLQLDLLGPLFERVDLPPTVVVSGLLESERFAPGGWRRVDEAHCEGWKALLLRADP